MLNIRDRLLRARQGTGAFNQYGMVVRIILGVPAFIRTMLDFFLFIERLTSTYHFTQFKGGLQRGYPPQKKPGTALSLSFPLQGTCLRVISVS
jgi:hypothetical protein